MLLFLNREEGTEVISVELGFTEVLFGCLKLHFLPANGH